MKILVIAPHPDDEVLGCGGVIKKHVKSGDQVYCCIVTKGYPPEWSEEFMKKIRKDNLNASKVLGIKKTLFLDLPTAKLDTVPQKKLNDFIGECVKEINPEVVYIPFAGDLSRDHRLIFESALVATRPINGSKIKRIMAYEVLSETEWGRFLPNKRYDIFSPNIYIDISETLKDKLKAMACYKGEIKSHPHPRSLKIIKALAQKRGSEAGLKAAEAFFLIREIL